MTIWKHIGTYIEDDQAIVIGGMNAWSHEWHLQHGEFARITFPQYKTVLDFQIYEIRSGKQRVIFAAREFIQRVWAFYISEQGGE
jgi:hypothetical protein